MKIFYHRARFLVVLSCFVLILCILIWRMYDLTVMNRQFLLSQGDARSLRIVDLPAYRGMITDRNGIPLAVSTPVKSVWINPKEFSPTDAQLHQLATVLNLSKLQLSNRVKESQKREFIYLQRQVSPSLAKKIASLNIKGINFQEEFKRYYPQAESSAQLIGFTNIDDDGLEGIEFAYQQWLKGVSGKKRVVKDRLGRIIEELDILQEPRSGHDLSLSIDSRIQYFAYRELKQTIEKFSAKNGSVVVLDAQSGEVLAIVNYPSFNPNTRSHYTKDHYRNKAITDLFEPGSVMKPFSLASALESGLFKPDSLIDTRPSWMMLQGHAIRDMRNFGVLDVTGVLQHSSNVGVTKMVLASPPEQLIGLLHRCGIGQRTECGYPGEGDGVLVRSTDASPFVLATLGFGYGMAVSTLQLAKSYLIFANEGRILPISLLHYEEQKQNESVQVISAKNAKQILNMMEKVVGTGGTGRKARVEGYRVAGKTGTSRIAGKKGYEASRHIATFVGIAPVSNPRLIVAVVIHEPTRLSYYGGAVAAPLFAQVMADALRVLDIQQDKPLK